MFKNLFGAKEKKVPEGYVPPSVPSLDTAGLADASRNPAEQYSSDPSSSAFSFISSAPAQESDAPSSSAFGFIAASPAAAPAQNSHSSTHLNASNSGPNPSSEFSFLQDAASAPSPSSSGFSFIQEDSAAQSAASPSGFSFIQDAPAVASGSADVDSKILEENMRVAGLKKVVKKRTMARKPGQAALDDDEPAANSSQKLPQPAVADVVKSSASVEHVNQATLPLGSSSASLPSLSANQHSEEPAFSFMTSPAVVESSSQSSTLPSVSDRTSGSIPNAILSILPDSDGENSDGGGLDLEGMIIHEVVPDALPPPVHQPQAQYQSSSSLQHWVELRDESGKMCAAAFFFPVECCLTNF